jgi:predicted kinase
LRTPPAVSPRELGLKGEGKMGSSRPVQRRWTAHEQKQLEELLDAGKTVVEIATVLQRTRLAIYARLQRRYRKRRKPSTRWPSAI